MKIALLALFVACATAAPQQARVNETRFLETPIEWSFTSPGNNYPMTLIMKIGTPFQLIGVSLVAMQGIDDLRIGSGSNGNGGNFKEDDSTSLVEMGTARGKNGELYGTKCKDVFLIGTTQLDGKVPFVLQYPPFTYTNYLGLGPVQEDYSFLNSILSNSNDKTMTLAFSIFPTSGYLTLGGTDKTRCYKDWRLMKEVTWQSAFDLDNPDRWGVAIDKLSAGKFAAGSPGKMTFTINDEPTLWPKNVYSSIIKELGSNDGISVPCDTKVPINFQVEDVTVVLTPDIYLDHDMEDVTGNCMLAGNTVDNSDEYRLPQAFFNSHCLSINHHTQQIGFATRRKTD